MGIEHQMSELEILDLIDTMDGTSYLGFGKAIELLMYETLGYSVTWGQLVRVVEANSNLIECEECGRIAERNEEDILTDGLTVCEGCAVTFSKINRL